MDQNRLHILFAIPDFSHGGAERCVIQLLKHLDRRLFRLTLIVEGYGPLLNLVPSDVRIIKLPFIKGLPYLLTGPLHVSTILKKVNPDLIVSSLIKMDFYMVIGRILSKRRAKLIIVNQNNISLAVESPQISYKIVKRLIPRLYPMADHLVSVSNGAKRELARVVHNIQYKQSTIYNPAWDNKVLADSLLPITADLDLPLSQPVILTVGRLVPQKDYFTLIRAIKILHVKHKCKAKLLIIGGGRDYNPLASLIGELNLADFIFLCGYQDNPYPFFKRADVFVLSSIFEGFGTVIAEALALGCPVVSSDCQFGPAEILDRGKYGVLVPVRNPKALASGIYSILSKPSLRDAYSKEGLHRAQLFRSEIITKQYEWLFLRLLDKP